MKKHLQKVLRKNNQENKNNYEIILSQNERNYPLNNKFFKKFINSISQQDLFFYPNTNKFKIRLSKLFGLKEYNVLLTPGSDIGIKTIFETFDVKDKNIITSNYCFPMYGVYSSLYQCVVKKAFYKKSKLNIRDILKKIDQDTQFIILANPNSPIGDYFTFNQIKPLLDTGVYVVIDEAYQEFTDKDSFAKYVKKYKNLIVLKTFSKAYGAAGCRVGYVLSDKSNIDILSKFRFMYEISGISLKYCNFVLDNLPSYNRYTEKTLTEKFKLVKRLRKSSLRILDTPTSWFFIKSSEHILGLFEKNRILVRTIVHPVDNQEWIKFNYDLSLKDNQLIDDLLSI